MEASWYGEECIHSSEPKPKKWFCLRHVSAHRYLLLIERKIPEMLAGVYIILRCRLVVTLYYLYRNSSHTHTQIIFSHFFTSPSPHSSLQYIKPSTTTNTTLNSQSHRRDVSHTHTNFLDAFSNLNFSFPCLITSSQFISRSIFARF